MIDVIKNRHKNAKIKGKKDYVQSIQTCHEDKPTSRHNTKCTKRKTGRHTGRNKIWWIIVTLTKVTAPMLANVHVVIKKKKTP